MQAQVEVSEAGGIRISNRSVPQDIPVLTGRRLRRLWLAPIVPGLLALRCVALLLVAGSVANDRAVGQAYLCTSAPIAKALVNAHKHGVTVLAVLDKSNETEKYSAATSLISEAVVRRSAEASGRNPDAIELWQIAALDCSDDGESSRRAIGKILAFITGYIVGSRDPVTRGVPPELSAAVKELCAHYSTRPGQADADLVERLGLFDYLARRHAICGTPEEYPTQLAAARSASVQRLMLSVEPRRGSGADCGAVRRAGAAGGAVVGVTESFTAASRRASPHSPRLNMDAPCFAASQVREGAVLAVRPEGFLPPGRNQERGTKSRMVAP